MHSSNQINKPRVAILITYPDPFTLQEAVGLVESSNCSVAQVFTQKYLNHAQYGVGAGKAEEIKEFASQHNPDLIVVDEHLTSKQIFNLEKLTGSKVIDRERLILDIFYSRATTVEAKLQIELAEIEYEMPRVRETAKMSSGGERAGKGGMGEYVVDVRFRDLKRRMSFIKDKLKDAQRRRDLYHQQRTKAGMPVVSLVGYTSAGKTTLFNLLTGKDKQTASSLFTTLSTTTGLLKIDDHEILATDTVGFISRLPTYMIDAFKSTLEESLGADLILLLVDVSEEIGSIRIKAGTCKQVLGQLGTSMSKVITVLTKTDLAPSDEEIARVVAAEMALPDPIIVSSKTGYGIRKLKNTIRQRITSK